MVLSNRFLMRSMNSMRKACWASLGADNQTAESTSSRSATTASASCMIRKRTLGSSWGLLADGHQVVGHPAAHQILDGLGTAALLLALEQTQTLYQILDQRNVTVALYHHDGCPFFIALGKWCVF